MNRVTARGECHSRRRPGEDMHEGCSCGRGPVLRSHPREAKALLRQRFLGDARDLQLRCWHSRRFVQD